jgi:DNA-binding CsgD family transcriptional regulator
MESLKQHHPDLTTNDTRLAALIKINLSQSNMAELLNITSESVRKARYRMAKKMNLESDQEMVDYIVRLD